MKVSLNDYLKRAEQSFYTYDGSLTTPDCDEVVNWIILAEIQQCSKKDLSNMKEKLVGNYRLVQDINNRIIYIAKQNKESKPALVPLLVVAFGEIGVVTICCVIYSIKTRKRRFDGRMLECAIKSY
eukprot:TRINITY_DN4986_c0_g1_i4.p1 TRINITY_DN4986_c0_g1~~TRINITY_DN4986_c0_g1_i4.p1  ORF type:complete len:126 (-),score=5.57 TRINITY_DN4986_c0_g1_i4:136-513(-)